jgi:hypothetical protein
MGVNTFAVDTANVACGNSRVSPGVRKASGVKVYSTTNGSVPDIGIGFRDGLHPEISIAINNSVTSLVSTVFGI